MGQRLKEAEMNADHDRYLRQKVADDSSRFVKENAILSQQLAELKKQLALVRKEQKWGLAGKYGGMGRG